MKRLFIVLILVVGLVGCTASASSGDGTSASGGTAVPPLASDYKDALSMQGQLALGTIQLEGTEQAVDETEAATLLPLWQALNALSQSDTAAEVEINAVVNQIADSMTPAQIEAIAAMQLTTASLSDLQSSGALALGGFGRGNGQNGGSANGGGISGDGFAGGGFPGGGPGGGGFPGGGPGGDAFIAGGGAPGGEIDPNAIATRQAQFAGGGGFSQETLLTNFVVRLLETKTGQAPEFGRSNFMGSAFTVVGDALGLTPEEIQTEMADGKTLADVIAAHNGDLDAIHAALVTALTDSPQVNGQDLDTYVTNLLNGEFSAPATPTP